MIYYLKEIASQYGKSENITRDHLKKKGYKKTSPGYGYTEVELQEISTLLNFTVRLRKNSH